jgi:hypothetical protein
LQLEDDMFRNAVAASGLALSLLAGCGGEDSVSQTQTPYAAAATAASAGALAEGCDAVLVHAALVFATARCADLSSHVAFGEETRNVTRWTIDRDRDSALGDLDAAPAGVTPLAIVPPRVGCGYAAEGDTVCIDALASGAVLKAHGARGAREGTPLVDADGRLVGIALSADGTRFLSAIEQRAAL